MTARGPKQRFLENSSAFYFARFELALSLMASMHHIINHLLPPWRVRALAAANCVHATYSMTGSSKAMIISCFLYKKCHSA